MHCTALLDNVRIDVPCRRLSALQLDLHGEKLILTHLFVDHLPSYRILFHLSSLGNVGSEHSQEVFHQVGISVHFCVRQSGFHGLALLLANLYRVEAFVKTLTVQVVLDVERLSFEHQTHRQDDITLAPILQLALAFAPLDLQGPLLEQSLHF